MLTFIAHNVRLGDSKDPEDTIVVPKIMCIGLTEKDVSKLLEHKAASIRVCVGEDKFVHISLGLHDPETETYFCHPADENEADFYVTEDALQRSEQGMMFLAEWDDFFVFLTSGRTDGAIVKWAQDLWGKIPKIRDDRENKSVDMNGVCLN